MNVREGPCVRIGRSEGVALYLDGFGLSTAWVSAPLLCVFVLRCSAV